MRSPPPAEHGRSHRDSDTRTPRFGGWLDGLRRVCPMTRLDGTCFVWPLLVGLARAALEGLVQCSRDHPPQELGALAAAAGSHLLQLRRGGIIQLDHDLFHILYLNLAA